jgi:hypothetical protein
VKPVADFLPTPAQVLAVGDVWDDLQPCARLALITLAAQQGCIGVHCQWLQIPATFRLELVHRVYLFRDFINEALP